jgi:hypothetical protein
MEIVKVYSPVNDKEIRNNLNGSPIWKQAYHADELGAAKIKHAVLYEYSIKFNGLQPIQVTGVKEVAK